MSMYAPEVSSTSSHARGPRPLSITCVKPSCACVSKPRIELLELLARGVLDVAVERVAVRVDADGLRAERLGEPHHARGGGGADADLLVLAGAELAHARGGMQQEGAGEIHRRFDALVEDPDLRAVTDADDVALHDHLVAGVKVEDLL